MEPLANKIRPNCIADMVGQRHLLDKGKPIYNIIQSGRIPNMIFCGPSGTGKTTLANIIAKDSGKRLHRLNATNAGMDDIRTVVREIDTLAAPNGILLYLDEIQYFNKKQQQSLLEYIETGQITLIASTTENPYFYIYNALLSRSTVFEFKPVEPEEIEKAINRAFEKIFAEMPDATITIEDGVASHIAKVSGGDVRKALNAVEVLCAAPLGAKTLNVSIEDAKGVTNKSSMRYDRADDEHYDILSAFQKSIRGSDPNAALHYLGRLVLAQDLPSICRRLLVIASEDIGLAYPQGIVVTKACVDAAIMIGFPEARIPLSQATVLLATAPKSNTSYTGLAAAIADIEAGGTLEIPVYLKQTPIMHGNEVYKYSHSYSNNWVAQQYLPAALQEKIYYEYGGNKLEQATKAYWDKVKGES